MNGFRKMLLCYFMLSKRLLKKNTFLLLLCAIPLLVVGMQVVSKQDSGMLTIVLCQENPEDSLSSKIVEDLLRNRGIINYQVIDDGEEAYREVVSGRADAVWFFPDEMQKQLDMYTAGNYDAKLLHIVEREDNVALQLSREKLYGSMYSHVSYSIYRNYITYELLDGVAPSEDILLENFEAARVEGDLFEFAYANEKDDASEAVGESYLTTPLRGMLALVIVLCGLAAAMYYLQDERNGVFARVPLDGRKKYFYAYEFTAMIYAGIAVLIALLCSGIFTRAIVEFRNMALFILATSVFCSIATKLCGKIQRLGTSIPILMLLMFVLCPVFFEVKSMKWIQYLLPPFYYLNSIHNDFFLYRMLVYCVALIVVDFVLEKLIQTKQ